ncbi:MAG: ATP-dependent DNA helicase RecG [Christensenellales bacterium]|jgi:ATP-dependent DNA helicase RecG
MAKPLTELHGIGPKTAGLLKKLGLRTCEDLLGFYPRTYRDFSTLTLCAEAKIGDCALRVRVLSSPRVAYPRRGLSVVTARCADESGQVSVVFYNQPYMAKNLVQGEVYCLLGRCERKGNGLQMVNPSVVSGEHPPGIIPVYPLTAGLTQSAVRKAMRAAFEALMPVEDPLPSRILTEYGLMGYAEALTAVHFPPDMEAIARAKRRLAIEEVIYYVMAMELVAKRAGRERGRAFRTDGVLDEFLKLLPFAPTNAQLRAMQEIERDMASPASMNRMVQGDVGSGKTAVALFAAFVAAKNGAQAALMVPTEILARQHYQKASELFFGRFSVELLIGNQTAKQRREAYDRIEGGQSRIVIGTQALLQEKVRFFDLGLIVADEQHRFGVRQRAAIANKAEAPDVLVLSATPIPRSLALVLFGDMDVSVIDDLPPGRKPVKTRVVPYSKRGDMYRYVAKKAMMGEQTYVVCPLVEDSEDYEGISAEALFAELVKGALSGVPVELLHGKMAGADKQAVLDRFRNGETKVLISTTVVEVGVDVPGATVMIVENARRFGLAQLHQLRGRVGRGTLPGECYLCLESEEDEANERLSALCQTTDGFAIAMKDLTIRGPGALLGTAQSGVDDLAALRQSDGMEALTTGRTIAKRVMEEESFANIRNELTIHVQKLFEERMKDIALN